MTLKLLPLALLLALLIPACSTPRDPERGDRKYFHSGTPYGSKTGVTFAR